MFKALTSRPGLNLSIVLFFAFGGLSISSAKEITLTKNKVHEECLSLNPSQKMSYSFTAVAPLDFNIHYHVGEKVFYPVKKDKVTSQKDVFKPKEKQDYCLMWTNTEDAPATLKYEFHVE